MTLAANFRTEHGAVLRNAHPISTGAARRAKHTTTDEGLNVLPRTETRIFTIFPERAVQMTAEARESARRRACLIGMCAPTSVFIGLAAWYLTI